MKELYFVLKASYDEYCRYTNDVIVSWHTDLEEAKAAALEVRNSGLEGLQYCETTWDRVAEEAKVDVKVMSAKNVRIELPYNKDKYNLFK